MPDGSAANVLEQTSIRAVESIATGSSVATRDATLPAGRSDERQPVALVAAAPFPMVRERRRRSPILWSFFALVVLPTIAAGLYFSLWASDAYVAEFRATVRSVEPLKGTGMTALLGLAGASQSMNDAHAVVQYLESRDALEDIDKKTGLHTEYQSDAVDWLSRMRDFSTIEAYLRYWRRHLDAYYETTTGTIVVKITAFTPEMALSAATAALTLSEELVNRLSTRSHNDSVLFAERQLADAEQRLTAANQRLQLVQDQEKMLDPQKMAASTLMLAAKLKEQLVNLTATMSVQRNYLSTDSPVMKMMQEQIDGLQREIDKIDASTTAAPQAHADKPLSSVLGTFNLVESDRGFAEKNYQSTLTALEAARIEASRQQVYLATIVRPELPQEPAYPRPWINTATVFGIASLAFAIGLLSILAVKEHV